MSTCVDASFIWLCCSRVSVRVESYHVVVGRLSLMPAPMPLLLTVAAVNLLQA